MRRQAERIQIIERSLYCYACGWCSFIPYVGIATFIFALTAFQEARMLSAGEWNPARRYLNWGMTLATIGAFISIVLSVAVVCKVLGEVD